MIVGVCGFGYTGSGTVLDYLKERSECDTSIESEFVISYIPHGLLDLERHLTSGVSRYFSSDAAIKEFLRLIESMNSPRSQYRRRMGRAFTEKSVDFIQNLTQVSWSGQWAYDSLVASPLYRTLRYRIFSRIVCAYEQWRGKKLKSPFRERMYLSVYPPNFCAEARSYTAALLDGLGRDRNRITVLNQPFAANAPEESMKFFDDPRAIIVDRDPRDIYLYGQRVALSRADFMPTADANDFAEYYRRLRMNVSRTDTDSILHIAFEDMIYNYEDSIRRIEDFLGLEHIAPTRRYFDPQKSIGNTQLFRKYADAAKEMDIIERELPDYLYPFEKYPEVSASDQPFLC